MGKYRSCDLLCHSSTDCGPLQLLADGKCGGDENVRPPIKLIQDPMRMMRARLAQTKTRGVRRLGAGAFSRLRTGQCFVRIRSELRHRVEVTFARGIAEMGASAVKFTGLPVNSEPPADREPLFPSSIQPTSNHCPKIGSPIRISNGAFHLIHEAADTVVC